MFFKNKLSALYDQDEIHKLYGFDGIQKSSKLHIFDKV